MKKIKYVSQNDPERQALERERSAILCEDLSLTIQDAPDTDINEIARRFGITDGSILPGRDMGITDPRYYGDYDAAVDLRQVLDNNREAEYRFAELPADVRRRFDNNANTLWNFLQDDENLEEAVTLGLLKKTPPRAPQEPAGDKTQAGTTAPDPQKTP